MNCSEVWESVKMFLKSPLCSPMLNLFNKNTVKQQFCELLLLLYTVENKIATSCQVTVLFLVGVPTLNCIECLIFPSFSVLFSAREVSISP